MTHSHRRLMLLMCALLSPLSFIFTSQAQTVSPERLAFIEQQQIRQAQLIETMDKIKQRLDRGDISAYLDLADVYMANPSMGGRIKAQACYEELVKRAGSLTPEAASGVLNQQQFQAQVAKRQALERLEALQLTPVTK